MTSIIPRCKWRASIIVAGVALGSLLLAGSPAGAQGFYGPYAGPGAGYQQQPPAGWGGNTYDPRFERREEYQQQRIQQGIASGELTRGEARYLEREQARIDRAEQRMAADGNLSPWERQRLNQMQNRASRDIYRLEHNDRTAAGYEGHHEGWRDHDRDWDRRDYGRGDHNRDWDRREYGRRDHDRDMDRREYGRQDHDRDRDGWQGRDRDRDRRDYGWQGRDRDRDHRDYGWQGNNHGAPNGYNHGWQANGNSGWHGNNSGGGTATAGNNQGWHGSGTTGTTTAGYNQGQGNNGYGWRGNNTGGNGTSTGGTTTTGTTTAGYNQGQGNRGSGWHGNNTGGSGTTTGGTTTTGTTTAGSGATTGGTATTGTTTAGNTQGWQGHSGRYGQPGAYQQPGAQAGARPGQPSAWQGQQQYQRPPTQGYQPQMRPNQPAPFQGQQYQQARQPMPQTAMAARQPVLGGLVNRANFAAPRAAAAPRRR